MTEPTLQYQHEFIKSTLYVWAFIRLSLSMLYLLLHQAFYNRISLSIDWPSQLILQNYIVPCMTHCLMEKMSSSSRLLNLTPNGIKEPVGRSARGTTQALRKLSNLCNTLRNNISQPWHIKSSWWQLSSLGFHWRLWFRDCRSQEKEDVLSHSIDCSTSSPHLSISHTLAVVASDVFKWLLVNS